MKTKDMAIGMHVEAKTGSYYAREAFVVAFRTRDEAAQHSWYAKQDTVGLAVRHSDNSDRWSAYWVRPQSVVRTWADKVAEQERHNALIAERQRIANEKRDAGLARIKSWGIKPNALVTALGIGPKTNTGRYDYDKSKRLGLYRGERVSVYVDLDIIATLVSLARSTAPVEDPESNDALDHFLRGLGIDV